VLGSPVWILAGRAHSVDTVVQAPAGACLCLQCLGISGSAREGSWAHVRLAKPQRKSTDASFVGQPGVPRFLRDDAGEDDRNMFECLRMQSPCLYMSRKCFGALPGRSCQADQSIDALWSSLLGNTLMPRYPFCKCPASHPGHVCAAPVGRRRLSSIAHRRKRRLRLASARCAASVQRW
jgi:hypothetical protein